MPSTTTTTKLMPKPFLNVQRLDVGEEKKWCYPFAAAVKFNAKTSKTFSSDNLIRTHTSVCVCWSLSSFASLTLNIEVTTTKKILKDQSFIDKVSFNDEACVWNHLEVVWLFKLQSRHLSVVIRWLIHLFGHQIRSGNSPTSASRWPRRPRRWPPPIRESLRRRSRCTRRRGPRRRPSLRRSWPSARQSWRAG